MHSIVNKNLLFVSLCNCACLSVFGCGLVPPACRCLPVVGLRCVPRLAFALFSVWTFRVFCAFVYMTYSTRSRLEARGTPYAPQDMRNSIFLVKMPYHARFEYGGCSILRLRQTWRCGFARFCPYGSVPPSLNLCVRGGTNLDERIREVLPVRIFSFNLVCLCFFFRG